MISINDEKGKCFSCGVKTSPSGTIIDFNFYNGVNRDKNIKLCWDCSETLHAMLDDKIQERYADEGQA